ncbi:MAG: Thiosulfate sulfurtransferase, rhodanese, partial [uncultured Frankineae bacterium]
EPLGRARRRRLGRGPPGRPRHRVRRGRRGRVRLRRRAPQERRTPGLDQGAAAAGRPRPHRPRRLLGADEREGHRQRLDRRALRRQQQLVRGLRLLAVQAVRPRERQAARRRPQEVGARRARAGPVRPRAGHDLLRREGPRPVDPGVPRRGRRLDRGEEPRRRAQPRRVQRQDQGSGAPAAGAVAARRSHPDRDQHPVEQGGGRRRHVPLRRRAGQAVRRGELPGRHADHRLLPHRRALLAHLVRAARAARRDRRQELRRLLGRVRLARRRARAEGRL